MPYKNSEAKTAYRRKWATDHPGYSAQKSREWKDKNPEARALMQRRYALKRRGLSLADFDKLVEKQHGLCCICRQKPKGKLNVDHCHATNAFRGLLCKQCNSILGRFRDCPGAAARLLFYLEQNSLFSFNGKK